jgi:hypothetical protein
LGGQLFVLALHIVPSNRVQAAQDENNTFVHRVLPARTRFGLKISDVVRHMLGKGLIFALCWLRRLSGDLAEEGVDHTNNIRGSQFYLVIEFFFCAGEWIFFCKNASTNQNHLN